MNVVLVQALLLYFGIGVFTIAMVWSLRLFIDSIENKITKNN